VCSSDLGTGGTGGTGDTSNGGGGATNGGGGTGGSDPGAKVVVLPASFSRPEAAVQAAAIVDPSTAVPEIDPAPAVEAAFTAQPGSLPFTGFDTMPLFIAALAFLAVGAALQLHRPRPAVVTEG